MSEGKLAVVLLWGGSATFESDLYSYTSKLIRPRSVGLLSMRIRDLWTKVSSSKPLLKVGTKCRRSCRGIWATMAAGESTHNTANCRIRQRATELKALYQTLLLSSWIQPSFPEKVSEVSTTAKDMDQKS